MSIHAIIFGATGMVGQSVLLECLDSKDVGKVLLINRRQVSIKHEKLREVIHQDFSDFSSLINEFSGYNACYFCLGVSAVGLSEEEYTKTTYDLTISVAEAIKKTGVDFTFVYVSGKGTDSSEKGSMMWARVKGRTENKLLSMHFKNAYMFRPGFIQSLKGIRSKTKAYNFFIAILNPFYFLLKHLKGVVTNTTSFGKAMINITLKGYAKKIIENEDINILGS